MKRQRTLLWVAIGILAFVAAFAVVAGGFLWPRQQLEHGPWSDDRRESVLPGGAAGTASPDLAAPEPAGPGREGSGRPEPAPATGDEERPPGDERPRGALPGIEENARLPDVEMTDLDDRSRPLRRAPDEVTVINFWATWCVPCLREIPELVELHRRWAPRGLHVVGIAVDSGDPDDIRAFAGEHGMTYSLGVAPQSWAGRHFGVFGLPVTLVVDRDGRVRRRLIGPHSATQFERVIRPLL